MNTEDFIIDRLSCETVQRLETVQTLWSDYGDIVRYKLTGTSCPATVIAKSISPPSVSSHPRGWNTLQSHNRKLRSYEVEANWYRDWASQCPHGAPVPECFGILDSKPADLSSRRETDNTMILLLCDLDAAGFMVRKNSLTIAQSKVCISWLAHFHAKFMQDAPSSEWPQGLWSVGTYWHLATRGDEFDAMADSRLKRAAEQIDRVLNSCRFKTLVHGDAKVANFCFSPDGDRVAAVDFQYVGGGCGMKDLVYFIGSCLTEEQCCQHFEELLDHYFLTLESALHELNSAIKFENIEFEWRPLFQVAWADFQRFILGWSPEHKKNNQFSRQITNLAIESLSIHQSPDI
ncbi:oxidoreductase family protein [uncultured Shewanella sp.]|uniref:oxidoreductase family protein n=1 Tax=uncultured Shewanella sp. TaxID=173975 RepID=UPI0026029050|nr:oxidoreductase family protein [uncultured Shewanella sp.]